MKKFALRDYYSNFSSKNSTPICGYCNKPIKGWAISTCSNCKKQFCSSHMVPFIGNDKKCPACNENQSTFIKQDSVFAAMKVAENKIKEFRMSESENLENAIIASVFANKNYFKISQNLPENTQPELEQEENLTNLPPETQHPTDQVQENQISAPEQEQNRIQQFADNASSELAEKIAESLKAVGITSNTQEATAQILNMILSDNFSNENKRFAQDADAAKAIDTTALKGNPLVDYISMIQYAPEYQPRDRAPIGQLTPQEAKVVDDLYNYAMTTYGKILFERLPETTWENKLENRRRQTLFRNFVAYAYKFTNKPEVLRAMYQKLGLSDVSLNNLFRNR